MSDAERLRAAIQKTATEVPEDRLGAALAVLSGCAVAAYLGVPNGWRLKPDDMPTAR